MVFSSNLFIFFFLPAVLWGYYFLPSKLRNGFLLLASLVFFAWSQPRYLWVIGCNILINYTAALLIDQTFAIKKKLILWIAVCCNLGLLIYFKYTAFLLESGNALGLFSVDIPSIILPIGISFFTFQGLSYTIDVYRKKVPVQKNLSKVALYIVLFPQLIAGPIVRYADIAKEIEFRKESLEDMASGIERFIIGLAKKAILANTLAEITDTIWNRGYMQNTVAIAWLGSISYTLQIYYDFSGYSDMAIGLGRMFGFHFLENFSLPYIAKSITEFWRRWHISLSSWFRDYVYIPLGGNRKHVYRNLAVVFLLTGIWHGAAWNFVLWGIWHGIFILLERKFHISHIVENKRQLSPFFHLYTLFVVNLGWILFRAGSLSACIYYVKTMFGISLGNQPGFTVWAYLSKWNIFVLACAIFFATSLSANIKDRIEENIEKNWCGYIIKYIGLLGLFAFAALRVVSGTYNPFIYFQF